MLRNWNTFNLSSKPCSFITMLINCFWQLTHTERVVSMSSAPPPVVVVMWNTAQYTFCMFLHTEHLAKFEVLSRMKPESPKFSRKHSMANWSLVRHLYSVENLVHGRNRRSAGSGSWHSWQ